MIPEEKRTMAQIITVNECNRKRRERFLSISFSFQKSKTFRHRWEIKPGDVALTLTLTNQVTSCISDLLLEAENVMWSQKSNKNWKGWISHSHILTYSLSYTHVRSYPTAIRKACSRLPFKGGDESATERGLQKHKELWKKWARGWWSRNREKG